MRKLLSLGMLFLFIVFSPFCTKILPFPQFQNATNAATKQAASSGTYCYACGIMDNMPATNYNGDTIDRPSTIGLHHENPYTVANMQRAYNNLHLSIGSVSATNLYVRFAPSSLAQLIQLDSAMENKGLDLFDTPMDYDVNQEGEYYQDPTVNLEAPTFQYAVVPTTFQFPIGITYSIISPIHIPSDAYSAVETEAERLASIQDSLAATGGAAVVGPITNTPQCPTNCHWDFSTNACSCCPSGYTWNGTQCVAPPPPTCQTGYYYNGSSCVPYSTTPPPASVDAQTPAGYIKVADTHAGTPGVANVRVVMKRWFKVERVYTNNAGYFLSSKHFKHKVKINVKFLNSYATIRPVRGFRLWQMFTPITYTVGVFGSNKNAFNYTFAQYGNTNSKGNMYWAAATIHNGVQEHRAFATQFGFQPPPMGLRISLTDWKALFSDTQSTPLFGVRGITSIPQSWVASYMYGNYVNPAGGMASATLVGAAIHIDVLFDYHVGGTTNLTSDLIKQGIYHELCHASHYSKAGSVWYTNFVNSVIAEQQTHLFDNYGPYGKGNTGNSPIIALGEGWAYFMGFYLANEHYNLGGSPQGDDNVQSQSGGQVGIDLTALESFKPRLTGDNFGWIPKGLMYDLIDGQSVESFSLINDGVSGFTIQQVYNALQSDVSTLAQYKARFIAQTAPSSAIQTNINSLFTAYGY